MLELPQPPEIGLPPWATIVGYLIAIVVPSAVTVWRMSRGEKSTDYKRLQMENRMKEAFADGLKEHERRDDDTYVRKDIYEADKKGDRALGTILEKLERIEEETGDRARDRRRS